MKEDDAVESFFKGMQKTDENLTIPTFSKPAEPRRRMELPMLLRSAAALAAIAVASIFFLHKNGGAVEEDQMIILIGQDNMKTNSLIEEKSLSEWDSPTIFLAEDF